MWSKQATITETVSFEVLVRVQPEMMEDEGVAKSDANLYHVAG